MSKSSEQSPRRAVALQYGPGQSAPVIVASGMGNMAEKMKAEGLRVLQKVTYLCLLGIHYMSSTD